MKKWLIGICVLAVIFTSLVYIFIPGKIEISKVLVVNCTEDATNRWITSEAKWKSWWPAADSTNELAGAQSATSFTYQKHQYKLTLGFPDQVKILIQHDGTSDSSVIYITPFPSPDTIGLTWQCAIHSSLNPVKRILQYQQAVNIKKNISDLLQHLQAFLENRENLYHISIEEILVKDTSMMSVQINTPESPNTQTIYKMIARLKNYIKQQGANETNHPMINITRMEKDHYETRVAIPIDRELKGDKEIFYKRMVPGNILVAEVRGGDYSINQAIKQMENYIRDYRKVIIAIPFQTLVTDRMSEPDTSRWITKIYYPIIH